MSNGSIYLNRDEQIFLMEMFELTDPVEAMERFITMMVEERANPELSQKYLKKIMSKSK